MSKSLFTFLALLLAPTFAHAGAIVTVNGRAFSPEHCQYFSVERADFQVGYENAAIPEGSQVILHTAFYDEVSKEFWKHASTQPMVGSGGGQYAVTLEGLDIASRGSSYFRTLEFVVEIVKPDGTQTFDNGGQGAYGHYGAILQLNMACDKGDFVPLSVKAYSAQDASEAAGQ